MSAHQIIGNALEIPLRSGTVQTIVTSPPYFGGLRAYGGTSSVWGGCQDCPHDWTNETVKTQTGGTGPASKKQGTHRGNPGTGVIHTIGSCACGAWLGDLGAERTPGQYIDHLMATVRECKRVLRDDGVMFFNIADSYAGSGKGPTGKNGIQNAEKRQGFVDRRSEGRAKSLYLVPERLAIALDEDGWVIRNRIAWCKSAPMPGSMRDRFTSAWEHIWVVTKRRNYYWDRDAAQEAGITIASRNMRDFWVLKPDPYAGAHYATFPREIPRRCILVASRPGDIVFDPFSGSGTVAYMANILGRKGVGLELSRQYVEETMATGRLSGNQ